MKITVLGCGWLGFPLALQLHHLGHSVKGSTTTSDKLSLLKQNQIRPFLLKVPDDLDDDQNSDLWKSNLLILNIPPGRRSQDLLNRFPGRIRVIRDKLETSESTIDWVIFASSTSVYNNKSGIYTENDTEAGKASRASGEVLLKAEEILQASTKFDTTVVRFGGMYGYGRHPVKYLAGKKDLSSPLKTVNLIHQDDCIGIILRIIEKDCRNEIFNAVSNGHPPRKTFYQSAAKYYELDPPEFADENSGEKRIISNQKLKEMPGYHFIYPNPLDHTG